MSGLQSLLITGRLGVQAQQKSIQTVGHNIANVNTEGYSRQRVNMAASEPAVSYPGYMGTGVVSTEIQRIYDRYLIGQINMENQKLGRWESQKGTMERVEIVLNESTGYGLNQAMSDFWNSWQDLANEPSGHTERVVLLAKSEILTDTFNKVHADLVQIQSDIDDNIQGAITEINQIVGEINDLNSKIGNSEVVGQNSNDFKDQRDLLLKELSLVIDFTSSEGSDGKVTVTLGDGNDLVGSPAHGVLSTATNGTTGFQDVIWDVDGLPGINGTIANGKLKGWINARDTIIPGYLTELNALASTIVSEVNTLHSAGFGLDGVTGRDYFSAGTDASDISVDSAVVADVNVIAAAGNNGGVWDDRVGDGENAVDIADLQSTLTMSTGTSTFDDYYNSLVSQVGSDVKTAVTTHEHQTSMANHLDTYRESVSGVSIDEEMINLVKFQHAYNAAARLITTADEMMQVLINTL